MIKFKLFDKSISILINDDTIELKKIGSLNVYDNKSISLVVKNLKVKYSRGIFSFHKIESDINSAMLNIAKDIQKKIKEGNDWSNGYTSDLRKVEENLSFCDFYNDGLNDNYNVWYFIKISNNIVLNFHYGQQAKSMDEVDKITKIIIENINIK
jgi:hypothetical protein